jgi:hypothetical protein
MHKEYYKGEGGGFPLSLSCDESCESMYARSLCVHQKCSNYALTKLLFGLCRFMQIIDPLVTHLNLHLRVLARPSTL